MTDLEWEELRHLSPGLLQWPHADAIGNEFPGF